MQIKEMPASERPQEKMMFAGASCLSNSELLALIIRSGTPSKSSIQLAEEVIAHAESNSGGLGMADPRELMELEGIGAAKACSIVAAIELSKRLMSYSVRECTITAGNCEAVARLLMQEMMYEKRELFMSIHLNTKLQIESKTIISIGSLDQAMVHPREVFGPAVRKGAAAVVVAHNHPSGDPTPSRNDIEITDRLVEASRIIGIKLIDHIIIGKDRYVSLQSQGIIPA